MERIASPSNYPPSVGKFRPEQIATRETWTAVPDSQVAVAALHTITVRPRGSSTVTHLNPTDPGTVSDPDGYSKAGYLIRPGDSGRLEPAGRL